MASRGLGSLTLDLIAKIGGFTGPLTQAERAANRSMSNIEKRANNFGRAIGSSLRSAAGQFLAFAGVTASVGAALSALKGAIDLADETRDLSIRLGVSTETLSEFRYAAQQTGTDMDALGKGMKILSKNAAAALNPISSQAKVFDALGIKVTDASGNLKQLDDLIPEIAEKFKGLEDGTTKAALAQALFGKSGLELTEFLNQGADGLQTMADKARALGIVINEETADAADKFNDDLADLKASAGGLALQVAQELLPAVDDLVVSMKDFVSDGDNAKDIAHGIADGFRDMHDAGVAIGQVITVLQGLRTVLNGLQDQAGAVGDGIKAALSLNLAGIKDSVRRYREASAEVDAGFRGEAYKRDRGSQFQNVVGSSRGNVFDNVVSSSDSMSAQTRADAKKLALALSGGCSTGGGGRKRSGGGKSDEQKDADQLLASYQRMEASYKEQIALVGDVTEVEKLRYELANGDGAKFSDTQKQTLLDLAAKKDAQEADNKLTQEAKSLHEQLITPMEQINAERVRAKELLDAGKISQEDYNRALKDQQTPVEQMLEDLKFEAELLGKSREQQELLTAARYLGAEAATEQGKAALASLEQEQEFRKSIQDQTDVMDAARDSAKTFFDDLKEGKGVWDSLKDAAGNFADMLYDIASRKLIEQIFGQTGTTGSGSSGAGWLDAIFGLFSGGGGSQGWGGAATGGLISGPGTGTSDSIPARLSDGEFVIKAASVKKYGPGLLDALNMGRLPAFANGGMVGSMGGRPMIGAPGGNTTNVAFMVQGRMTRETQVQAANKIDRFQKIQAGRNR